MSSNKSFPSANTSPKGPYGGPKVVSMLAKGDLLVLLAAFLSLLFSISLWFGVGMAANKEAGMFVGIWVPSIISLGAFFHVAMRKP